MKNTPGEGGNNTGAVTTALIAASLAATNIADAKQDVTNVDK